MMLAGHDAAWAEWRAAMVSARMHHAWILAGPQGVGKAAFARAAAAALVAEPGLAQPNPAMHPDIIWLEALPNSDEDEAKRADGKPFQTKRNISIDQIRRMQARLTTRPTIGARRVVIIDPADELEKGAVNALLKSLEEPPTGTSFVLVAHRLGRLLPTIRSRCRILRFAPLDDAAIEAVLRDEAPQADAATRAAAIAAAHGSPGAALTYVGEGLAPVHAVMARLLAQGDPGFELRGTLAQQIGARPGRERQAAVLELARAALSERLADAGPAQQGAIIAAHADLIRLAAQVPTYNFDSGLLAMAIGGLLAAAAAPKEIA